jgi:uncharacterized protein YegJ (DUF2314 family)
MKVKEFFKSTAFKSLVVLLSIVIIAGALLAIFNDLLHVSDQEKFERIIKKIYGGNASVEKTLEIADEDKTYSYGEVNAAYLMSDGNYLVQSTGTGAFGNGTVTVYVVVEMKDSALAGIGKVVFDSTTVSKYYETSGDFFKKFDFSDDRVAAGEYFGVSEGIVNPSAGATASARSINNAVNTAIDFIKKAVLGQTVGEFTYAYEKYIKMDASTITPDQEQKSVDYELVVSENGEAVAFKISVKVVDGVITEYAIVTNGSTYGYEQSMPPAFLAQGSENYFVNKTLSDVEALLKEDGSLSEAGSGLHTGATFSTQSCIWAAAFATANFEAFLYPVVYGEHIDEETHTVTDNEIAYHITVSENGEAVAFKISVKVVDGVITEYAIVTNGSTYGFEESMPPEFLAQGSENYFVNKTLSDVEALLNEDGSLSEAGSGLHTGATYSTQSCIWAAAYALGNYDTLLAKEGGAQA